MTGRNETAHTARVHPNSNHLAQGGRWVGAWIGLLHLVLLEGRAGESLTPAQVEWFERRIRPVLVNECYECHGPARQRGGLRVDSREGLRRGGDSGPAIVPGDARASRLVAALLHRDTQLQMPKERPRLPEAVIASFVQWVNEGAPDPRDQPAPAGDVAGTAWDHAFESRRQWWSFQPLRDSPPPAVTNPRWPEQDIDRFILSGLESRGIAPAPAASPGTWLRRVRFVITGLPPSPAEIREFQADSSPAARARVVDRLLGSAEFGERWARHWMDLVRYAETYGHEQDYPIPYAWQYRDYLIRAFNADVPYHQLIREHVAGDLLDPPRRNPVAGFNESVIGTGFWYLHQATHAPVDPEQDEADRIDNQIDVFSKAFLGLTVACARCHDHKFDAISTRDYYSLTAYLRQSRQDIAFLDPDGRMEAGRREGVREHAAGGEALREVLRRARVGGAPKVAASLRGAREVLHGPARAGDAGGGGRPDVVFEDFEDGSYVRWRVEGDAFGAEPASGPHPNQQPVSGFHGRRLANSFTRGDAPRGALHSAPFRIERDFIRSLVGGGIPTRRARFVLQVGDREVRVAAGHNRELLEPVAWDVREFAGREATLHVIDDDDSTWGHINVDHIVFSDSPEGPGWVRPVPAVAAERGLNPAILARWARELSGVVEAPEEAPREWLTALTRISVTGAVAGVRTPSVPPPAVASGSSLAIGPDQGWRPSGMAFEFTSGRGDWRIGDSGVELLPAGMAHSGLLADGFAGTLRSPTFQLTGDNLHLRVAGTGGVVRLIICRYGLREFNPLLFEQTQFNVNTGGRFRWHSITTDLRRHRGRQAYLEFVDSGPGFLAVDQVIQSANTAPPGDLARESGNAVGGADPDPDPAAALEKSIHAAIDHWLDGRAGREELRRLAWFAERDLLDWGPGSPGFPPGRTPGRNRDLPAPMPVLAMTAGDLEEVRVAVRGNPRSPGIVVTARPLEVFRKVTSPAAPPGAAGRLELAECLVAESNPLVDRVAVNRIWAHVFGRGLVVTVDNFGRLGRTPSHPELLDRLALEFRRDGRSIKRLIRRLCLSATFQMSGIAATPENESLDPENALLHRMNLRRLEGEVVRDSLLSAAGRMNPVRFGPSVPTHFTPFMGDRMWVKNASGPLDGDRRRSIYQETRRNFLPPLQLAFDLPIPDSTIGQRNVSNVPGQSLTLMNDPFVRQQAEAWGRAMAAAADRPLEAGIDELFLRAIGRDPTGAERRRVLELFPAMARDLGLPPAAAARDAAVWAEACHTMFLLKEFIHVP